MGSTSKIVIYTTQGKLKIGSPRFFEITLERRCAADTYRDVARAPAWHQTHRRPRVTLGAADARRDCGRDAQLPAAAAAVAVHADAASLG